MPAMLKPLVTKPNTLPYAPGGVTWRTIMSRDGINAPVMKPDSDITMISSTTPRSMLAIRMQASAVISMLVAATSACRSVRAAIQPPTSTPIAPSARLLVSAVLAVTGEVFHSAPSATTEKFMMPKLVSDSSMKNTKLIRIGVDSSSRQLVSTSGAPSRGLATARSGASSRCDEQHDGNEDARALPRP